MKQKYVLTHVDSDALVRNYKVIRTNEREMTAIGIAHLAEIDSRKLYVPAGFPSMFEYCVVEFGMSEDVACNQIEVARKAQELPILFEAIEDGRLTLSAIRELGPHLNPSNASRLVEAAARLRRHELRVMLAQQFPRAETMRLDDGVVALSTSEAAPGEASPATDLSAHARMDPRSQNGINPLSPNRFALEITISQGFHDRLRYFQSLIGQPSNVADALDRALEMAIRRVERRKFGLSSNPNRRSRRKREGRYVPMEVRRAVWIRDEGRCTFESINGRRCTVTGSVEFDHILPFAQGGPSTADNIRLLCKAHNQYMAEQRFGLNFMEKKREQRDRLEDVIAAMRSLGSRGAEARAAAEHGIAAVPDGTLEEQIKAALRWYRPKTIAAPQTIAAPPTPKARELVPA